MLTFKMRSWVAEAHPPSSFLLKSLKIYLLLCQILTSAVFKYYFSVAKYFLSAAVVYSVLNITFLWTGHQ